MIVLKFGGTSLQDPTAVDRVVEIVRGRTDRRPLVVVSAVGKTTRKLLEAARRAAAGSRDESLEVIDGLHAHHRDLAEGLGPDDPDRFDRHLDETFGELGRLLDGMSIVGEVPPRALDRILSYGELLSSRLLADVLAAREIPARLLDARELIVTDDRHGAAIPDWELTRERLREAVPVARESGKIPILQGYIGSTADGATTTLGFEGSDYTATLAGAALDAVEIEIWKDVPGLMTADPAVVPDARTVSACSFAEAGELARFGAKVLHSRSIGPAAGAGVAIRIRSSRDPDAPGTRIEPGKMDAADARVVSIASKRPVAVVRLPGSPGGATSPATSGSDRLRLLSDALLRQAPDFYLVTASGDELVAVTDADGLGPDGPIGRELPGEPAMRSAADRGLVTLVGEGIGRSGAVGRAVEAIADAPAELIVSGASPRTVHLLVDADSVETSVRRLHAALFG